MAKKGPILEKINNKNNKEEYYLTDAIGIANSQSLKCSYIIESLEGDMELKYVVKHT